MVTPLYMAAKNPTRLPEFFASRTTSAMASTTPSRLCGCSPEPITTVPGQHYAGLHVPMVARVRRGCPDHQTAQAFLQRESPCDSAFSESQEVTRPRLDSCKPNCKRRGGDRTAGEDTKRGLAGPKTPILPRRTRFQDTSGYGVRRTFNPLVVGSSPTGPTRDPLTGFMAGPAAPHRPPVAGPRSDRSIRVLVSRSSGCSRRTPDR